MITLWKAYDRLLKTNVERRKHYNYCLGNGRQSQPLMNAQQNLGSTEFEINMAENAHLIQDSYPIEDKFLACLLLFVCQFHT